VVKVSLIGAGSHFTLGLLGDFFRVNDLWGSTFCLMDIDEKRLKVVESTVRAVVERRGKELKVEATTSLKEAVEGADFIICAIRAGGIDALRLQVEIPLKYGADHLVGDTTGPGGILKALLEVPAVLKIARCIEDYSPKALLINFTNPMTPVCTAVSLYTKVNVIGLCHGVYHIVKLASKLLNVDSREISVHAGGLNHFTWTTEVVYRGESVFSVLVKELFSPSKYDIVEKHPYLIGRELYKVFRVLPTLSDRHFAEFFPYLKYWLNHPKYGPVLKKVSGIIDFERMRLSKYIAERKEDFASELSAVARGEKEIKPLGEYALDTISSLVHDRKLKLLAINIPNKGLISGLPSEIAVEVPVVIDGRKIEGVSVKLPDAVKAWLRLHSEKYLLLVKGIVEGSMELVEQAMVPDPLTPSLEAAENILKEYLSELKRLGMMP